MKYQPNLGDYGNPHELPSLYYNVKSSEQRIKLICDEIDRLNENIRRLDHKDAEIDRYLDRLNRQMHYLRNKLDELLDDALALIEGGKVRNPVTGDFDYEYVTDKQMYDMLRVYAATWEEMSDTGKTYKELNKDGHTYAEMDMFANLYYGDGKIRAKYTDKNDIDVCTVGFGGKIHE